MTKPIFDVILYADWQTEIVEDTANPVFQEVGNIKSRVLLSLTLREYDIYNGLKWLDREMYIRERILELIQK